jgi:uncharacterized Fe-S cluster protein YjdI
VQNYPSTSQVATVSAVTAKFTNAITVGNWYCLVADTDIWWNLGATGGSAVAETANNHVLQAGREKWIITDNATTRGFVHVIRASADGAASLSLYEGVG